MGDEILSINGVSVKDKTLLNCANMLEEAEIVVALQIRKPDPFVKGSMLGLLLTTHYLTTVYHSSYIILSPAHITTQSEMMYSCLFIYIYTPINGYPPGLGSRGHWWGFETRITFGQI